MKKLLSMIGLFVAITTSWALGFSQCTVPLTGTIVKTENYPALAADSGKLIAMNCTANCSVTLPTVIQAPNYTLWISNIGSARVFIGVSNPRLINRKSSNTIEVPNGETVIVSTDGTDY